MDGGPPPLGRRTRSAPRHADPGHNKLTLTKLGLVAAASSPAARQSEVMPSSKSSTTTHGRREGANIHCQTRGQRALAASGPVLPEALCASPAGCGANRRRGMSAAQEMASVSGRPEETLQRRRGGCRPVLYISSGRQDAPVRGMRIATCCWRQGSGQQGSGALWPVHLLVRQVQEFVGQGLLVPAWRTRPSAQQALANQQRCTHWRRG